MASVGNTTINTEMMTTTMVAMTTTMILLFQPMVTMATIIVLLQQMMAEFVLEISSKLSLAIKCGWSDLKRAIEV